MPKSSFNMKKVTENFSVSQVKRTLIGAALSFAMFLIPQHNFAQAPNVGTAADFILFSSHGAVTNTGMSQFTGNVGTNNGPVSGFGNVNGVMHDQDDATATCAADLLVAYNQLKATTPTFFPSRLLGNNDMLIAGVYEVGSSATLNGNLYLNAKGKTDAVFIFQIKGAFSTFAGSKIKLINGAQACNVFWQIEGLVSMASATYMRGTIIANNAAIITATNDSLEGRLLSTTGAISVDGSMTFIPTGCGVPLLGGPVAPVLGSVGCYGVFSGNGAVTNSGVSHVIGDVGTNVGLAVGYDPLFEKVTIHLKPDVSTAQCALTLQNIYVYIKTLVPDIELLYPAQFGNNLVLTPHTYLLNTATTLTDTVFLNSQGNPNGVFIIKINGALSTSAFSKVVMTNGTQAKNVFWQVEGAVEISNYSIFCGTIIANNAAIHLDLGDSLNGRALTTSGALTTATLGTWLPQNTCITLPVKWLYLNGTVSNKNILLQWGAVNTLKNTSFSVEKSKNATDFSTMATVNTVNNTNGEAQDYSFTDAQPNMMNYYRILQTDNSGQRIYSKTIQVKMAVDGKPIIKTYIQGRNVYVNVLGATAGNGTITLYNIQGRLMLTKKINLTNDSNTYKIENSLQKGIYIINVESLGTKLYTGKVAVL